MGTEILRPQDCLTERIRFNPAMCSRRRNYGSPVNPNYGNYHNKNRPSNRRSEVRHEKPDQRRRQRAQSEPSMCRRTSDDSKAVRRSSFDDLVMEKVTILRRGEPLDSKIKTGSGAETTSLKKDDGLMVPGTVRIVNFRPSVSEKNDVYAGSAFAVSPEPCSLPLPSFSKKKQISIDDDSATRDIKRLLRLEL